jgi:flavorubredoxin/flavin reductase (DIM6/NTAB) family NADH-FMN oxidoreductase RutF
MHSERKISENLYWVGANDRRIALFENAYPAPNGVSYNAYLMTGEQNLLFDTVDKSFAHQLLENLEFILEGGELHYIIVNHVEPDHSGTICDIAARYPNLKILATAAAINMLKQFYDIKVDMQAVNDGESVTIGGHTFTFVKAPMVHWPEVMVTFEPASGLLFSADAFGTFGALNGGLYSDDYDFERELLPETRRYYTNIVGKYGTQVTALLEKAAGLPIKMILPLHGPIWRGKLNLIIEKYQAWANYLPEDDTVAVFYASVYGNTQTAAELIAADLTDKGVPGVKIYDVSKTDVSYLLAEAFRAKGLVFASTTYNAGIFIHMEDFLHDIAAHNLKNRVVAYIANGSWAPTVQNLMPGILKAENGFVPVAPPLMIKSSLKPEQRGQITALAGQLAQAILPKPLTSAAPPNAGIDPSAMFKLSYGLFVLTAKTAKDNGCIINTVTQITDNPKRIMIAVNKANFTHDQIVETGIFNVSILDTGVEFDLIKRFGFASGKDGDKFAGTDYPRTANGLLYIPEYSNAFISAKVTAMYDYGTHTVFIADVTESKVLAATPSVTYQYYFDHIKPKPAPKQKKKGWICKVCGYVYEGEELPPDFVCPLCKHGAEDFVRIE